MVLNDGTTAVARTRWVGRLHRAETLTNAAKHAQASVVRVDIKAQDAVIQLSIRNDGIGRANHARGSGLLGLQGPRVETVGGSMVINSTAGAGTSLLVTIPTG